MPNSQTRTSTSVSTKKPKTPLNQPSDQSVNQSTTTQATQQDTGNGVHDASNGSATANQNQRDSYVPEDAGSRIPIPIRPVDNGPRNGTAAKTQTATQAPDATASGGNVRSQAAPTKPRVQAHQQTPKSQTNPAATIMTGFKGAAAVPNVMRPEFEAVDDEPEPDQTVEGFVQQVRPKSIRLQLRFIKTLVFAFSLFGRLIFWQVYMFSLFPGIISAGNTRRWRKYARQFRKFAIEMGGVMIKAGQFASTRADVLPEEVIMELSGLHDRVPTIPFKRIRKVLVDELGDIDSHYQWIDETPIAAASLGQAHRAKLKNGDRVVIKVQRPGVRDIVYTDLAALFIVARVAMRFNFISRRADVVLLSEEFGRVLLEEVSYEHEVGNAKRFYRMFQDDMGVYIPSVYQAHSTDQVLTIEDVTSVKVDDYQALAAAGIDRKDVAKRLMDTYMQQIFVDRFFHADPHPGNLFVYPLPVADESQYIGKGGRPFYLIFIDFGMTGSLTPEITQALIDTLVSIVTRNPDRLVDNYEKLGLLLPGADKERIREATKLVFDEVWGMSMTEMTHMDFETVQNIGREFNDLLFDMPFRVPQDFVYLGRTVAILTGMCTALDSEYNPWVEIQYYMQQIITEDEDQNIFTELSKELMAPLLPYVTNGPAGFIAAARDFISLLQTNQRTERLLTQIAKGEVAIVSKPSVQYRRQLDRIEAQGRRTTRAFLFGTFLITSTMFYTNGDTTLAVIGYTASGVVFIAMMFVKA